MTSIAFSLNPFLFTLVNGATLLKFTTFA